MAANVNLSWPKNLPEEQIVGYVVVRDGNVIGSVPTPAPEVERVEFEDANVAPGVYSYVVMAKNEWPDPSAPSDPVKTPPGPSKPTGVVLRITVSVQA